MPDSDSTALHVTTTPTLCVDFVNTLAWRGSAAVESLHRLDDVIDWLVANQAVAPDQRAAIVGPHAPPSGSARAADLLRAIREAREALYRSLRAVASGDAPAEKAIRELCDLINTAPPRRRVIAVTSRFEWELDARSSSAALILAPILWSAADLLVSGAFRRLRECANNRCLWLFLDDSRSGRRRWCSMQSCGNRAKAQRHYQRRKDAAEPAA
ncbi:MAG TPA: CGNR zinc finger domain-containing protein [Candidatus Binataceae bacterium]|nr:CGNR zinc finger domain-containing protein [Candidatus Binataceae bacterium]